MYAHWIDVRVAAPDSDRSAAGIRLRARRSARAAPWTALKDVRAGRLGRRSALTGDGGGSVLGLAQPV